MPAAPSTTTPAALRWDGRRLRVLDQTLLPRTEAWLELSGAADTAAAIGRLAVRGAPNIGIAAAYGLAMEVARLPGLGTLEKAAGLLRSARPTAVNLAWAVDRVHAAAASASAATMAAAARAEAQALHARPLLQGARLTVWELARAGLAHELLVDGAAAGLMRRGEVDAVLVGCDRVAANGDTANKVGTYAHALAARAAGIPFVVAGPTSTIDAALADGDGIAIEERDPDEVRHAAGVLLTLPGTPCRNPAFDVTPAGLISALVTERGVAAPVDAGSVAALLAPSPRDVAPPAGVAPAVAAP